MPRYAAGATPESGCVEKNGAIVPWSPAAMPATWVPCSSSPPRFANGSVDSGSVTPGGTNDRATITFGVVKAAFPFGYPGGY